MKKKELMSFGKYQGTEVDKVPLSYRCWFFSINQHEAKRLWPLTFSKGQRIWFGIHEGEFVNELPDTYVDWLQENIDEDKLEILFSEW
jgi:uncharacterized protein (DUF3820 family)